MKDKGIREAVLAALLLVIMTGCGPALHKAIEKGNFEKAESLLEKDPLLVHQKDKEGRTPLYIAAKLGNAEMTRMLLARGADVNEMSGKGFSLAPLHAAVWEDHVEVAAVLIEAGADVNARDWVELTPLHYAGSKEAAQLLIENGAEVNARDGLGRTPLDNAIYIWRFLSENEAVEIADVLIRNGADVNGNNAAGVSPILSSVIVGWVDYTKLLIDNGADVNCRGIVVDGIGSSPLHAAIIFDQLEVAELLLASGAAVNAKDEDGKTPLQLAQEQGHGEMVELLRKHGAK